MGQTKQSEQVIVARDMKSANFFQMSGIPKFGKNWLDNFIPDEEMQSTFMTSEIVRNVLMLECVYFASIYSDLFEFKHTYGNQKAPSEQNSQNNVSMAQIQTNEAPVFKLGIIGCGQVGTSLLTKLLEAREQFGNLEIHVSTRQPHLLNAFKREFGIEVYYDNANLAAQCDLIFVMCLPNHA